MVLHPALHRRIRRRSGAYLPDLRRIPRRQGRGDARRRHHGRKRPAGAALLRRLVPRADDYALRIAGLDGRRVQLPHFHAHFAESEPSGSVRRVLVHHRRAADLHAPQEHRKAQGGHGIENLHLETPPRETAAPQAGKKGGIKTAQKALRQGLWFKTSAIWDKKCRDLAVKSFF